MAAPQHLATANFEKEIKRNPHGDFKQVEASRPAWDADASLRFTQTVKPSWTFGEGGNGSDAGAQANKKHLAIDPYGEGRPAGFNYKLLISAVIPRPIAFLSTRSADGVSTNLAPFSYFQMISHDPPLFVIGFVGALEPGPGKDSLRNLAETGECVINIISEGYLEAANSASINAPYGVSEWDVSGLTPLYDCETVQTARVGEAVFSIEGRLESLREFESRATPGKKSSTMAVIEGTRFWAREDAINEDKNIIDPNVARTAAANLNREAQRGQLTRPPSPPLTPLAGADPNKKTRPKTPPTASPTASSCLVNHSIKAVAKPKDKADKAPSFGKLDISKLRVHFKHNPRVVPFPLWPQLLQKPRSLGYPQYQNMTSQVTIIGTPTADTPGASLSVQFGPKRYFFGRLAEGTQRLMNQRKSPLTKLEHIFLTGAVDSDTTGGMMGMILSIADVIAASNFDSKKAKAPTFLNLHGGKNLMHTMATSRHFILRKGLPIKVHETRTDPRSQDPTSSAHDFEDENFLIWNVPLTIAKKSKKRKLSQSSDTGGSEEFAETEPPRDVAAEEAAALQQEKDQLAREAIVNGMFNSDWALDALHECKLFDVKLPATIFVRDDKGHIQPYAGPLPSRDSPCPNKTVLVRKPWPATQFPVPPRTYPSTTSMCYIVKSHPRRGKFDTVTPDMVVGPSVDGSGFAIIDLGQREWLVETLLSRPEFANAEIMRGIDAIYWILHPSLTEHRGLAAFMEQHSSIKHIVLGHGISSNRVAFESPGAQIVRMNRIDPERFPISVYSNDEAQLPPSMSPFAEVGRPGAMLHLVPNVRFTDDNAVPYMDRQAPLDDMEPTVLSLADAARETISDPAFKQKVEEEEQDIPNRDTEIIPLGTGSAMPSKYRNVSATLIRIPGYGSYLLDAGEGTLGQLRRMYGFDGADDVLRGLRAIYISHLHADHHLGTASVMARRWKLVEHTTKNADKSQDLTIIATRKYLQWLQEYQDVEILGRYNEFSMDFSSYNHKTATYLSRRELEQRLNLPRIDACLVSHCQSAMAVAFTWPSSGLRIAYSGDCRPSAQFAQMARGAHLLIHECTFDDELLGDAKAKKHSTLSEALEVGRQMGARRIMLTHFSQRYPKLPNMPEVGRGPLAVADKEEGEGEGEGEGDVAEGEAEEADVEMEGDDNQGGKGGVVVAVADPLAPVAQDGENTPKDRTITLFAFDLMRVKLGDFKMAEAFLPALRQLFPDEEEAVRREEALEAKRLEGAKEVSKEASAKQ
ncbi:hypothetical protein B0T17DRAFT_616447 [Bombardia bombarda]|uniref:ribonuclease Z n=1 Tax=Bombardia bombarda TaxID=252184 RepID=A0AA39XBF6_9PEZI|nr:hypothetical protein B0T17DRAFT_616447 [Bombardia bombarda]